MTPASDPTGPATVAGQPATPPNTSPAADEVRAEDTREDIPLPPVEDPATPDDSVAPDESDLVDLPDEELTAEERLLDTIVSDSRQVVDDDAPTKNPETAEDVEGAAGAGESPAAGAAFPTEADRPAEDALAARVRCLEEELRTVRDALTRVTADRDDLARRFDLAAIEFERMSQEIDAGDAERGKLRTALEAAEGSLKAAQDRAASAVQEAEDRAARALQERDAAAARIEEMRSGNQREQDQLRATIRQLQAAADRAAQFPWPLVAAGAVAIALVAAAGGYAVGWASSPPVGDGKAFTVAAPLSPPIVTTPPVRPAATNVTRMMRSVVAPPAWPVIRDPRMVVSEEPGALVIRFKNPVFARGAEILPAGRQDLRRLAAMLRPHTTAYRIEVEGHTDALPVAPGVSYGNNHELGIVRARAVMEVFTKESGLPASALSISSAGDTNPALTSEAGDARRHRTVVIKLHHAKPAVP